MAAFPGSHDHINTPSALPVIHQEAAPSFPFPTKGSNNLAHASSVIPKHVPLRLLQHITKGFSEDRLLGAGAYGKVYKGIYETGETMAVKLFHYKPGLDHRQFEKECLNLASLQHKNIVRLVGFCHDSQKQCVKHEDKLIFADEIHMALCFEYMHNGSLADYLHDEKSGHGWPTRYAIIKGICEGLEYLHEELKPDPIYHMDLKPANILLDDKMSPKLADFGLSRLFGEDQTRVTESCVGTPGYLPPEYIDYHLISNKVDIFSLGVIILKIIAGPEGYTQSAEMHSKQFIELVQEKWSTRFKATLVEATESYSEQLVGCIEMALSCVEKERQNRPRIRDIIAKLNKMDGKHQGSSQQVLEMDICSTPTEESVPPAASYTPQETTTTTKGVSRLREHVDYVMGDLVIGLAKSVVAGALKVQSAIEEANKLPQSAQRDLVFITGEFQMLHSFLSVADEERVKNIVVKTWVRQMRELAYDLEDCIEFVVNMDMKLPYWVRVLPPFMDFPRPQDMVADEIEQLRARVQDVSMRNSRYSLISDSGSKPVLAQQQPAARADTRRQHVLGDLTQLITKKEVPDLQVISVWGAGGGIGTTSVIRKAYSDPEISYNFTCRAWVNITHPFNPQEFVRSLMAHFYANRYKERPGTIIGIDVLTSMNASTTKGDLLTDFVQLVDKTKYLVILEDVCTIAEWDSIRTFLPDRKNGSCIIVSSQQYEIASLCVGHPYQVLDLKQLPAEHSVCAFLREGSQDAGDESDANNDSTRNKEMSTKYDLSHDQRNGYSSFHRIPKSRKKAAIDWMHNSPLVGCRLKLNQLRSYIAQAQLNNSRVMSVWGIPGVGKSSLVRNLYYDQVLENQKFQEYSWVSLSHTQPFNLRDFSRRMLLDFQSESLRAKETVPARSMVGMENAVQKCRELLSTRPCLVIIDGLQSTEEWDSIQFSLVSRHSRSKTVIIVVTTEASVATYCADKEELVFNVKALEADAALDLLKNEVSKKTPFPASAALSSRENAVLHEIVPMCGGLPLLIVAMAGILATNVVGWMESASNINLGFMHELEINPEFESLWDLFSWMHSCFRTCPDSLKACMFSLSLFPRNHNIRRRRLVRRWIAEGYCRDSDNKSAEENGDEFFSKLLNLSLIQQPPQSDTAVFSEVRMVLCRVNGFLRECILSRGMEESHVIELAGSRIPTTQHSWRHLVISESWDRRIVLESIELSRLRSMTVFGNWQSFFISRSMKLLRVLDLEDAVGVTDDAVEDMVKLMPHLKFLSLRGCKEIFQLPRSLGRLRQLQTLDVTNTSIITLPETISKLQKLQYIRCGITATASKDQSEPHTSISLLSMFRRRHRPLIGVKVPSGIEKLTALHTLGIINIRASGREAIRKVLKNLTQLRKLGVFGVNFNNRQVFSSAISSYGHLGSLSVWLDKESRRCLNDICLPLKNIQSLKLYGLLDRLPVLQVDELSKLAKLHLEMDGLREQDIEILGKLPKLCILRLRVEFHEYDLLHFRVFYNGLELPSYQKLRVLDIACRSSLHVTFASLTMKKLELLKVDCSGGSSYQLSGLDHLSELREVCLNGSYEETLKQFLQGQLAHHPRKPELKLEEEMPRSST